MSTNRVRLFLCLMIVALLPASVMAAGVGAAMAHPYGAAWLNGAAVEHASAIFPGDLVQTNPGSILKIDASGSSVTVLSDSLLKFNGDSAAIESGSAKLMTSTSMSARAGKVTVTPASSALTEFQVTRTGGTVQVVALKGDLQISNGSETKTLSQGQQATQTGLDKAQSMQGSSASIAKQKDATFSIETARNSGIDQAVKITAPKHGSPIKP